MLYWFGVYTLVGIAVVLPFVALYIVVAASWLGLAAARLMIRRLKNALVIRQGFSKLPSLEKGRELSGSVS